MLTSPSAFRLPPLLSGEASFPLTLQIYNSLPERRGVGETAGEIKKTSPWLRGGGNRQVDGQVNYLTFTLFTALHAP